MSERDSKIQIIRYAPPPPELPIYGRDDVSRVSFIGRTNYSAALEEKRFIFGIKRTDRRLHLYVIGKSGVGKSKLLELLIRQDIEHNQGVCILDPRGELVRSILDFIPERRMNDVCIIDPTDMEYVPMFNPFVDVDRSIFHQLSQSLTDAMARQFGENWTSRLEHIFRFACLALLDYSSPTLAGIVNLLTDKLFRDKVTENISDPIVARFWNIEFERWVEKFEGDAITPIVAKMEQFFSHPTLRAMASSTKSVIRIDKLIRERKIILINLAKQHLGEENSSFFGALFLAKIREAITECYSEKSSSSDFYLYLDEFHSIASDTLEHILSEGGAHQMCVTISHQYMQQISSKVQAAVLGNIGSIIVFRVGGEDAQRLESEMIPVFKAKDMINLGKGEFYTKLTIDGNTHDPFSAEVLTVGKPTHESLCERIIEQSRSMYSEHFKQT